MKAGIESVNDLAFSLAHRATMKRDFVLDARDLKFYTKSTLSRPLPERDSLPHKIVQQAEEVRQITERSLIHQVKNGGKEIPFLVYTNMEGDRVFGQVDDHCLNQLASYIDVPFRYIKRMRDEEAPELMCKNLNHWLKRVPEKSKGRLLRSLKSVEDGSAGNEVKFRSFHSDRYSIFDDEDLFAACFGQGHDNPATAEHYRKMSPLGRLQSKYGLDIVSMNITDNKFYLKVTFPHLRADVATVGEVGDIVQYGLSIGNSEVGKGAIHVDGLLYRLICSNGMVVGKTLNRRHLGQRNEFGEVAMRDDTRIAYKDAMFKMIRDVIEDTSNEVAFKQVTESIRLAQDSDQIVRPIKAVEYASKELSLSSSEAEKVTESLIMNRDYSQWGMVNAITATANVVDDYDRASELEVLGGQILTFPKQQWRQYAQAA